MGISTQPSPGALGRPFHYLNAQKRILRDYAKNTLGLGIRWRCQLSGVKSPRGMDLGITPSSQWTQEELDTLYTAWSLVRPTPEALRAKTCVSILLHNDNTDDDGPCPWTLPVAPVHVPTRYANGGSDGGSKHLAAARQGATHGGKNHEEEEEEEEDMDLATVVKQGTPVSRLFRGPPPGDLFLSSTSSTSLSLLGDESGCAPSDTDSAAASEDVDARVLLRFRTTSDADADIDAGGPSKKKKKKNFYEDPRPLNHERMVTMEDLMEDFGPDLLPYLGFGSLPAVDVHPFGNEALPPLSEDMDCVQTSASGASVPPTFFPPLV